MHSYQYPLHSLLTILLILAATMQQARAQSRRDLPSDVQPFSASSGISFTENRGQVTDTHGDPRPDILYTIGSPNATLYLAHNRISYVFNRIEDVSAFPSKEAKGDVAEPEGSPFAVTGRYRMDMELVGSSPNANIQAEDPAAGYSNYYLAHCPNGIHSVVSYRSLVYRDIYPRIDMVLHAEESGITCDFVVHPGGRVADIRMRYVAASQATITHDGALNVTTPMGYLQENAPYCYQSSGRDSTRHAVAGHYGLSDNIVSFEVEEYDRSRTLVIDPYRRWATYYGGSSTENLIGSDPSEVDRSGNTLIAGYTASPSFPITTGAFQTAYGGEADDAFVVKFNSSGSRLWATYYGGNGDDMAHAIATDVNRNVFIAGHTVSANFPVSGNAYQTTFGGTRDAFIVKFDSTGTRQWGTFYGGGDFEDGYGFAIDSTGNAAVSITTGSIGLGTAGSFQSTKPSASGNYDALIVKFSSSGARLWATYYGGSNTEYGYAATSDINDNIIITGWTSSTDFPTTNGAQQTTLGGSADAFVVKLSSTGVRRWGTYYGGSGTENDNGAPGYAAIATDVAGNIFITGITNGNFPTTTGASQTTFGGSWDGFAVKFDTAGVRQWGTYLGGSGTDIGTGIASNAVGGVLVTGFTSSTNFPVTTDAYQGANAGAEDLFITRLSSAGARVWSTYYGGTGNDDGEGISLDPFGSILLAGHTQSTNFPTTTSTFQTTYAGNTDAFIIIFCDIDAGVVDTSGVTSFCAGDSVILSMQHGYSLLWSNGATTDSITVKQSGDFWVRLTNGAGCQANSDTIHVHVYAKPTPTISGRLAICVGDSSILDAGAGYASYRWSTGATTRQITVKQTGAYRVTVTTVNGCTDSSQAVTVKVGSSLIPTITANRSLILCQDDSVSLDAGAGYATYLWSNGAKSRTITVKDTGRYAVTVTNGGGCGGTSQPVIVYRVERLDVIPTPANGIDFGQVLLNTPSDIKELTITNQLSRNAEILELRLMGNQGFKLVTSLPRPIILKPGEQIEIQLRITPTIGGKEYRDSLLISYGCLQTIMPLHALSTGSSAVDLINETSAGYSLSQNDPNPFSRSSSISFTLGRAGHTTLEIFNATGQNVTTLVDRQMQAGTHAVQWDASGVAAGVYYYRLTSGAWSSTRSMVLR